MHNRKSSGCFILKALLVNAGQMVVFKKQVDQLNHVSATKAMQLPRFLQSPLSYRCLSFQ